MSELQNLTNKETSGWGRLHRLIKKSFKKTPKNIFGMFFVFSLILIFSFVFANQASAATIYVSNSSSNGYAIGNNSNTYTQAQNKSTPKLTVAGGISVAQSGDTIVINNGTYVESSYLNPGVSNLTINPESDYGVTVQVSGTPSYIFVPTTAGLTIGKIILDGQNIANEIIHPGAVFSGLTINGTRMLNFKQFAIDDVGRMTNLTMTGGWFIQTTTSTNSADGINLSLGNSTNSITNGTINITTSASGVAGILVGTTVANNNTNISNLSINIVQTNSSNTSSGIIVLGSTSAIISNNNLTISGGSSNDGISVPSSTTIQNTSTNIHDNTVLAISGTSPGGHGIIVGNDSTTPGAGIVGPLVYKNTVTGFNHGMGFFCGVSNGIMSQNIVNKGTNSGGGTIGFILKQGNNNLIASNIVTGGPMTGGSLRSKADTNGSFINNTVIVDTTSAEPIYVTTDPNNSKNTTGEYYSNNIIFVASGITSSVEDVDASNTSSFSNNDYYGTFSTYPFHYQNTSYTSFSLWKANIEPSATNYDPIFSNISGGDYTLNYLSPIIGAGVVTSVTTDYVGNPIYGTPDIGAYEYQPPHNLTISTPDTIDIGAGARIYADGKFRDLGTTNSTQAHLKITPQSGSFTTYDAVTTRPAWLDVTNITNWTNAHKTWTESNAQSSGMVTNHTVGDLEANKYYNITVTGALDTNISGINGTTCSIINSTAVCQANGSGILSFQYNGGYSTHTFDLQENTDTPSTPTSSVTPGLYNSTQTVILSATGSTSIRYATDIMPADCSSGTSYTGAISVSSTQTIYARACNSVGNYSTASFTYTIDTNAPTATVAYSTTAPTNGSVIATITPSKSVTVTNNGGLLTYTFTTNGTFTFQFIDGAGNTGSATATVNNIKTTPPETPTASPSSGSFNSTQSVTLSATGSDYIKYATDAVPSDCSSGTSFGTPISVATSETIYVRACDNAGNSSTASFVYVILKESHTSSGSSSGGSVVAVIKPQVIQQATTPTVNPTLSISFTPIVLSRIIKLSNTRMWGNDVLALQTLLNTKGYDVGTPDGNFGPKTQTAVVAFQKANGITPDGAVGPNTLKYMNESQASSLTTTPVATSTNTTTTTTIPPIIIRTLRLNMAGQDVKQLQIYLNTHGYIVSQTGFGSLNHETIYFQPKTETAVKAFQTANGLTPDGVVGTKTMEVMNK